MTIEPEISDPPELVRKLQAAARVKQSSEEILEQRVSFVMGSLNERSGVTREKVRSVILKQEGRQND